MPEPTDGPDNEPDEHGHDGDPSRFERLVSALIRVDPRGIAGKHRREPEAEDDEGPGQ